MACDIKTRYIPATLAWLVLLSSTVLFFYYPCQFYLDRFPWVPAYQGVITFFVIANFTLATFMDPGVIPKAPPDEDREDELRAPLYKNADINGITVRMKWCVTCKFYRPPRCSHCSVCNHCIEIFDHHCPWVNNCIGRRNYRFFFFFLISLSIHMLSIFILCLIFVLNRKDRLGEVATIVALVLMALITILAIPVLGLTGFHMVLVSRGRTTNEQVTGKFKGGYNPFSRGCWHNCCYTQFGPQYPSFMKPHKYAARRTTKENQMIATIGTAGGGPSNGGGGGQGGQMAMQPQSSSSASMYDRDPRHTQVKTYTDHGNGHGLRASGGPTQYSKLTPGRECSDNDMEPQASQSQDCEPTPPLQRHGSKNNFYMSAIQADGNNNGNAGGDSPRHNVRMMPRHSPHMRQRGLDPLASPEQQPPPPPGGQAILSPPPRGAGTGPSSASPAVTPTPTMQQRIKALGVATPLALSASPVRRSNPGTPTQPRRPDFIGVHQSQQPQLHQQPAMMGPNANYYDFSMQQQPPQQHPQVVNGLPPSGAGHVYPMAVVHQQQQQQQYGSNTNGSPQRRYLSEGELIARQQHLQQQQQQHQQQNAQLEYYNKNRSNSNLLDGDGQNIRELAGSPQRGNYLWKDQSPVGNPAALLNGAGTVVGPGGLVSHQINLINMRTQQQPKPAVAAPPQQQQQQQQQQPPQQYRSPYAEHSYYHHRSNPTSPTQQQQQHMQQQAQMRYYNPSGAGGANPSTGYHPALRGGVPVFPVNVMAAGNGGPQGAQGIPGQQQQQNQLSPQVKRRTNVGGYGQQQQLQQATPTRPISFVRALEMSDSIELLQQDGSAVNQGNLMSKSMSDKLGNGGGNGGAMSKGGGLGGSSDRLLGGNSTSPRIMAAAAHQQQQQQQNGGILVGGVQQQQQQQVQQQGSDRDRAASVYDMNYEISV